MSDFEEGEVSSGGEEEEVKTEDTPYNPLERPKHPQNAAGSCSPTLMNLPGELRPRSSTNSSMMVNTEHDGDMEGGADEGDFHNSEFVGSMMENNSVSCSSSDKRVQEVDESDDEEGLIESSSEDNSSDDGGINKGAQKPRRKKVMRLGKKNYGESNSGLDRVGGGGSVFDSLATKFQDDRAKQGLPTRKKQNNVWGSILQEESLTSELTGIGVGRSLKDLGSDRGAETYDFVLAQEHEAKRREDREKIEREKKELGLDKELKDYWASKSHQRDEEDKMETGNSNARKGDAIKAGRKRSVKDRLGSRPHQRRDRRMRSRDMDEMSIPPPGVSRTIPDLSAETLTVGSDEEFGRDVAHMLSEPKTQLMVGVVEIVGRQVVVDLFAQTQRVELDGGMMIKNGERRRTPGGVFLQLLRDNAPNDARIDEQKIKHFFAQSNRPPQKPKRNHGPFKSELEYFKKLTEECKRKKGSKEEADEEANKNEMEIENEAEEEEEELKPLPDILSCIAEKIRQGEKEGRNSSNRSSCDSKNSFTSAKNDHQQEKYLKSFVEPDAPPNSVERVERTISSYDDDILGLEVTDYDLF